MGPAMAAYSMNKSVLTQAFKTEAQRLGFLHVGVAKAQKLWDEEPHLEQWLKRQFHGGMAYMANHFDMRLDPTLLVPGAKSVISLSYSYFHEEQPGGSDAFSVAKYAHGDDYHRVLKEKLTSLMIWLNDQLGEISGRAFTDSAPILEKAWAVRAGLGWQGKNSNLIHPKTGSFFFLAEIILDVELAYDEPFPTDHCGTCTKCIDACPTDAILPSGIVDGSKCISYFTIEHKGDLPDSLPGKIDPWIFGCDVCQDVCPWNRFSKPTPEARFKPSERVKNLTEADWVDLSEEVFQALFRHSPLKRSKFDGIKRNIRRVLNERL